MIYQNSKKKERKNERKYSSRNLQSAKMSYAAFFLSILRLGISNASFVKYYGSDNTRRINYRLIMIIAFHAEISFSGIIGIRAECAN